MEATLQEIRALMLGVVIALLLCFFLGVFVLSFLCEIAGLLRENQATKPDDKWEDYHDTMM